LIDAPQKWRRNMKLSNRQIAQVSLVDVSGRIVAGEESTLRDSIRSLLAQGQNNIVLNLQQVPSIDSAGIGELVSALVAVRKQGGSLKLLNPSRRVREVLQIVKLVTVFQIFDNELEAIASVSVPRSYARALAARAG
jgi:anti-sigma B factor antagonist